MRLPRRPSRLEAIVAMAAGLLVGLYYAAQQGWLLP